MCNLVNTRFEGIKRGKNLVFDAKSQCNVWHTRLWLLLKNNQPRVYAKIHSWILPFPDRVFKKRFLIIPRDINALYYISTNL